MLTAINEMAMQMIERMCKRQKANCKWGLKVSLFILGKSVHLHPPICQNWGCVRYKGKDFSSFSLAQLFVS